MADLKSIKRPSLALVKLVEATGILLGIPRSAASKSIYKAPTPTNYDDTVEYLNTRFYYAMNFLLSHKDKDIPNDVASDLYAKLLEPGYSYDDAVRDGGLLARDLFNLVNLTLVKLQTDEFRIPIREINVVAIVDGSRSSYGGLDAASHLFSHGRYTICAVTQGDSGSSTMRDHLYEDIVRRCKLQFKLFDHNCMVVSAPLATPEDLVPNLLQSVTASKCDVLVMGVNDSNVGPDSENKPLLWACWSCPVPLLLVKGSSRTRAFSTVFSPRVFQICIKDQTHLKAVFKKSLSFMRPCDSLVLVALLKSKGNKADSRDSRHDMGMRSGWVTGPRQLLADFPPEYSTEYEANLREEMQMCIDRAQVVGRIRLEPRSEFRTVAQTLCHMAYEEQADVIVLNFRQGREVITETVREAKCSVAIVK